MFVKGRIDKNNNICGVGYTTAYTDLVCCATRSRGE